jgi:hypothetical protein
MQPGTGAEPEPGRSQRREELPRRLDAAQAGLPGQRHAVIRSGAPSPPTCQSCR